MVILIVRTLYCKHRLFAVLIFGKENVAIILEITVIRVDNFVGVYHNAVHIVCVDVVNTCTCFISVTPCQVKIAFCKVCSGCHLVGTAVLSRLFYRQNIVSNLKVADNLAEEFFISVLVISYRLLCSVVFYPLINPRYFTEYGEQLIVEMSTEEFNLSHTLACSLGSELALAVTFK